MMKFFKNACFVPAIVIGIALGLSLSALPVGAVPIIDFEQAPAGPGGVITFLSGSNASGSGIPLDTLTVSGAPVSGTFDTTGTFAVVSGSDNGGTAAVLNFDTSTNSISVVGGVPGLGIPIGTLLLTGTFQSFTVDSVNGSISGKGIDVKDPTLLTALDLPYNLPFSFFEFTLTGQEIDTTGTFLATSTDVRNTAVPEPATMLLLGSGLLGIGIVVRRKFKK